MKTHLIAVAILSGWLALGAASGSAKPAVKAKNRLAQAPAARAARSKVIRTKVRALEISPLTVKTDNAADLLGVMMWEFDVQFPQSTRDLDFVLELREKGKAPQRIVGAPLFTTMPAPADGRLKIFVGAHPLSGMLREPGKVKYMVRINGYRISKISESASHSSSVIADNPFEGLNTSVSCAERKDGSFVLVASNRDNSFSKQGEVSDVELVFAVRKPL